MVRTPCQPGAATERDQHRAGRYDLLSTPFETFERNIREQLMAVLGPGGFDAKRDIAAIRSEEHTSELQSLMRISYAVFCLQKKRQQKRITDTGQQRTTDESI